MELDEVLQRLQTPAVVEETESLHQQLETCINELINTDFNRLVQLLYTVDVDEQKLKATLRQQPHRDAASLIAELLLTRLQEKAQSRKRFSNNAAPGEEERW